MGMGGVVTIIVSEKCLSQGKQPHTLYKQRKNSGHAFSSRPQRADCLPIHTIYNPQSTGLCHMILLLPFSRNWDSVLGLRQKYIAPFRKGPGEDVIAGISWITNYLLNSLVTYLWNLFECLFHRCSLKAI